MLLPFYVPTPATQPRRAYTRQLNDWVVFLVLYLMADANYCSVIETRWKRESHFMPNQGICSYAGYFFHLLLRSVANEKSFHRLFDTGDRLETATGTVFYLICMQK